MSNSDHPKILGRSVHSLSWQSVSVFLVGILQLGLLTILARFLTPRDFGLAALINLLVLIISTAFQMGIGPAIIQKKQISSDDAGFFFMLSSTTGLLAEVLLWLVAPVLARSFSWPDIIPMIRLASFGILINSIALFSSSMMQKNMNFRLISYVEISSFVLGYAFPVIILAVNGYGAWSLVISTFLQNIFRGVAFLAICPPVIGFRLKNVNVKPILGYSSAMTMAQMMNQAGLQGDNYIVGKFLGAAALGYYERSFFLMTITSRYFGRVLDTVMFPAMAQIQDCHHNLRTGYLASISILNTLLFPISIACMFFSREIVLVILGKQWLNAILPFKILLIALSFRTTIRIGDSLARAVGQVSYNAVIKSIYACLVILLSLVGVRFGIVGVACGVTFAVIVHYVMMLALVKKAIGISWKSHLAAHLPGVAIGMIILVLAGSVNWFSHICGIHDIGTLACFLIIALVVVLAVIYCYPKILGNPALQLIEQLLTRIKGIDFLKSRIHASIVLE